ncbi:Lrp/AsnC family transcriptional regulator [Vibrio splendidus]|uniref:Lrp/AsnC family transcriptional regulator n=1 Tax=Vibrio splendidus TaxID=29497 RepID=UPI000D36981C|nr:Lrp/AsnC family transcriptional regulator [Vibrio splendidus]PTP43298.1 hypothetical protein CWN87_11450 [Vibrio splendidus]
MIVSWTIKGTEKVSSEARMLLLLMYLEADSNNLYKMPILHMVQKYKAPERLIRRSIRLLIEVKAIHVITEKVVNGKRGRPVTAYQLTGIDFDDLDSQFIQLPKYAKRRVNHLWYGELIAKELTLSNRLMLFCLLSKAKVSGVVDSISLADLCSFMGCSERKAQAMISKLRKHGYIKGYVAGLNHSILKKQKSLIFIELKKVDVALLDCEQIVNFHELRSFTPNNPVYNLSVLAVFKLLASISCKKEFAEHMDFFVENTIVELMNSERRVCVDIEWYEELIHESFMWEELNLTHGTTNKLIEYLIYRALEFARTISTLEITDGKSFAIGVNRKNQRCLLKFDSSFLSE